jgi:biopolymer transport protein ExbD
MSIRLQCPQCGDIQTLHDKAVGRSVRCPACQGLVVMQPLATDDRWATGPDSPSAPEPEPPPIVMLTPEPSSPANSRAGSPAAVAPPPSARKPIIVRHGKKPLEAEMDMTPMVDVTFQLLIFFMLTASFTMQKSLNVPKPESNQPSTQVKSVQDFEENPDYVVVRVDATNTFHVSASAWEDEVEAPSKQELLVKLRQARQGDGQGGVPTKLLVVAHGDALHEYVVTAIDAGNDVGMDEVQLVSIEDDAEF